MRGIHTTITARIVVAAGLAAACALVVQAVTRADPFTLPANEEGLPGEGKLRRYDGYVKAWHDRREAWSKRVAEDRGSVVFLGDSITAGWGDEFRGRFPGMRLANRGIGGDTTRGMLIRLADDVLAVDPAAIVILAGTNDIEVGIEPEAAARNVGRIVERIKAHDAARAAKSGAGAAAAPTPIVLCRVMPSTEAKKRPAATIRRLNELLDGLVRGDPQVTVLDTWTLFADPAGDAMPVFFPDLLHLNPAGYDRWAAGLRPILATLGFTETEPDAFVPEEGFTSLFNGRDLTGWGFRPTPPRKAPATPKPDAPVWVDVAAAEPFDGKVVSSDGRYAALAGRLVVKTPPEGRRIQQLWTTAEFADDFVLKLEFRATPNADSGVFIRQPQLQCRDYALAGPWKTLGKYRPQEWNELVVTVADGVAKATCNGEPIPEEMKVPATGPIGLEGDRGQMEYRRIRLKTLPKAAAPGGGKGGEKAGERAGEKPQQTPEATTPATGKAAAVPEPGGFPRREERLIAGFRVHVTGDLFAKAPAATAEALRLLEVQLDEIVRVVPAWAVTELRKVPLYVSDRYPGMGEKAEYHPDAGWLRAHGRDPAMERAVEFTNVRSFADETRRMPNFALHELAHAFHHRVLPDGFDNADVRAAHERARAGGGYDRVERRDAAGRTSVGRAYALETPQEFFAESSEAFFARNDFFPYDRAELERHDPATARLLAALWRTDAAAAVSAATVPVAAVPVAAVPVAAVPVAAAPPATVLPAAVRAEGRPRGRPNVILFIADDVSWDDIGCYGNPAARTPRIDRLAAAGRRFDAAILAASSCSPSRASIITGRYPHNCGRACELHLPIAAHLPWFPRLLREAGYHTALVGKNHMSTEQPAADEPRQPAAFDVVRPGTAADNHGGHADWVATVRDRPRDRPFFGWFAALDAHRDWDADDEWREDRYGPRHDPAAGSVPPFLVDDAATRADLASFRNEVTRFDHFVGEVVDELERQAALDDTILVVMADNGRPFPRAKTRLHDSGMRTPLVVHWPRGTSRPGTPTSSLVSAIDIAPTLLAAAGVQPPATMQGTSFLPLLADPEAQVRAAAFSEHNWHDYEAHGRSVRTADGWLYLRNRRPQAAWQGPADSVRSPAHKSLLAARAAGGLAAAQADVFRAPRPAEELFFTPDDPHQLVDLAADPGRAAVLARLRSLLDDWTEATRDSAPDDLSRDEHDREQGTVLPELRGRRGSFRGTAPGMDRDAAHTNAAGPR
jgi:N-sulfoglucosamine sulfohydrolase